MDAWRWVVGNLISRRAIQPDFGLVSHCQVSHPGKAGGQLKRHPWRASTNLFCSWSVFHGLGSIFMNWSSLNQMVLWCFNVTVLDPVPAEVLLRFWNHNQPKTRWAPVSRLFLPSLFWCCLLRPLFTLLSPALSSISVLLFLPWWPNAERRATEAAGSLTENGSGLPGLAGALVSYLSSPA